MKIGKDYRITVIDPDSVIIYEENLKGFDLDKSVARGVIMNEIAEAIEQDARDVK